jgi:hypothetical protein
MQVPAVARARNIICATIGSLPLRSLDENQTIQEWQHHHLLDNQTQE